MGLVQDRYDWLEQGRLRCASQGCAETAVVFQLRTPRCEVCSDAVNDHDPQSKDSV